MVDIKKLFPVVMGGGFKLPYSVDFSVFPDGTLPSRFSGNTWSISSGKAINTPTISPTELLTNGNMETGDPPTGWLGINATLDGVADERTGGAGIQSLEVTASATSGYAYKSVSALNKWAVLTAYFKKGTSEGKLLLSGGGLTVNDQVCSDVDWTLHTLHDYCTLATDYANLKTTTNLGTTRWDDVSIKEITGVYSGLLQPSRLITVKATTYLAGQNLPVGVWMCGNSAIPTSGVFAVAFLYFPGYIQAKMYKLVNGTMTALKNGTPAYAAGGLLEIRRTSETTFQLWYNGTQVSTDATVSDAEIINNYYVGMLSTGGSGSSIGSFFLL